jgi:hypothetical protein
LPSTSPRSVSTRRSCQTGCSRARCCEPGSAVIAGHVDYNGRPGVFFALDRLDPGAIVDVVHQDGSTHSWRVVARRQYVKSELPTDLLFARTGAPTLTLVTCGGLFDASRRSYRDNVVVFAVPA